MAVDVEIVRLRHEAVARAEQLGRRGCAELGLLDVAAIEADEMVMVTGMAADVGRLGAGEQPHGARLTEQLERPVGRRQAQLRVSALRQFVEVADGEPARKRAECCDDGAPLRCRSDALWEDGLRVLVSGHAGRLVENDSQDKWKGGWRPCDNPASVVGLRGTVVALSAFLALVSQAGGETRNGAPLPARSTAYGVKILLPNAEPIVAGAVSGPPSAYESAGGFTYPAEGSVVSAASVSGRASLGGAGARALAGSDLRKVVLFGGEITADAVIARSTAVASPGDVESDYGATQVTNLVALGQPVSPSANLRVALGDWGHMTLLQEHERRFGRFQRGWVTVLDVQLDVDHAGLPVGTRILVGYADATARAQPLAAPLAATKHLTTPAKTPPAAQVPPVPGSAAVSDFRSGLAAPARWDRFRSCSSHPRSRAV